MSTPSIKVGQGNWGIKAGNLLAYANTEKKFAPVEFTSLRALNTATRVNPSGNIEIVNADIPRIDYFGGQASLLVEPSGTNSILQSTNSTSGWTLNSSMTSATIDVIGVSGVNLTVGASGTIGGGASSYASPVASPVISLVSGSTYTVSFFTKRTTAHTSIAYFMTFAGAASGSIGSSFDVSGSFSSGSMGGVYNTAGVTNRIRMVERWGTDVFRCSETFTMTASGTVGRISIAIPTGASSQTSAPIGTTIGFAAPQLELGSAPTSFIPTTTGTVTRNVDSISVTGVAGLIEQTEGTIYLETDKLMDATLERFLSIYSSTSPTNDNISISKTTSNTINFAIRKNNVLSTYVANFSGTVLKLACAFNASSSGVAIYVNGVQLLIDTNSGSFASALDEVYIGRLRPSVNTDNLYNGRIHAAALYTTRLTNAQLEYLTSFASYEEMASTLSYTLI